MLTVSSSLSVATWLTLAPTVAAEPETITASIDLSAPYMPPVDEMGLREFTTQPTVPSTTEAPPPVPESVVVVPSPVVAPTTEIEVQEAPPTTAPPPQPPIEVERCSSELAGTVPHVARVGHHIADRFGIPLSSIQGRASRTSASDHPSGRALDYMVNRDIGDRISEYVLERQEEFGITYVIWRQRYNPGSGWEPMEDRGGVTANHFDHVHISFGRTEGTNPPC